MENFVATHPFMLRAKLHFPDHRFAVDPITHALSAHLGGQTWRVVCRLVNIWLCLSGIGLPLAVNVRQHLEDDSSV